MLDLVAQFFQSISDWLISSGLIGIAALATLVVSLAGAVLGARRARGAANDARESASVATRTLHRRTNQYASDLVLKSDESLIAHPELAVYFKDPHAVLPTDELALAQVMAIAELRMDVAEAIWDHHDEFKADDAEAWREWIHYALESSPALQHEEIFDAEFYPSTKSLLAGNGCSKPDEHTWAVREGRKYAGKDLSEASTRVLTAVLVLNEANTSTPDSGTDRSAVRRRAASGELGRALGLLATTEMRCRVSRAGPVVDAARAKIAPSSSDASDPGSALAAYKAMDVRLDDMKSRVARLAGASANLLDRRSRPRKVVDYIMGEAAPSHLTRDVRELVAEGAYSDSFRAGRRQTLDAIKALVQTNVVTPGDVEIASGAKQP